MGFTTANPTGQKRYYDYTCFYVATMQYWQDTDFEAPPPLMDYWGSDFATLSTEQAHSGNQSVMFNVTANYAYLLPAAEESFCAGRTLTFYYSVGRSPPSTVHSALDLMVVASLNVKICADLTSSITFRRIPATARYICLKIQQR